MLSLNLRSLCYQKASRAYATIAPPMVTRIAQANSAALKIKERREKIAEEFAKAAKSKRHLTLAEKRRLVRPLLARDSRRSRLRGVRVVKRPDGSMEEQIVGQRIYLPGIVFTLVKNHTPAGKPYNPYEATFHVPQFVTKTDIRSYLHTVYGVACTYIRTDNYLPSLKKQKQVEAPGVEAGSSAYKRAVVGLQEPFYYPKMVEDMDGRSRWLRLQELENMFKITETKRAQEAAFKRFRTNSRETSISALTESSSRKKTVRTLLQKKEEREQAIRKMADKLDQSRG